MRAPIAIALAAAVMLAAAAAAAAELRPVVEVSSDLVTVGDLFSDAGEHADVAVLYAPAPGQSVVLGANFLYRVARAYGLAWQPGSDLDRTVVQRATQTLRVDAIRGALDAALAEQAAALLPVGEWRAEFDRTGVALSLPAEVAAAITVADLTVDPATRVFSAVIAAAAGTPYAVNLVVTGRLIVVTQVPVLAYSLGRGEVVDEGDIAWLALDAERIPANAVLDVARLLGQSTRRALPAGRPLREDEIEPPRLIERGALVTIVLETAAMRLTAEAQALEDGVLGGTIRVVNTQSHRTIQGIVVGANEVRVVATDTLIAATTPPSTANQGLPE